MSFSFISATSITATTTEAYSYGWLFLLMIPAMILVALAANFLIIPVFFANKLDNCYEVSNTMIHVTSITIHFDDRCSRNFNV